MEDFSAISAKADIAARFEHETAEHRLFAQQHRIVATALATVGLLGIATVSFTTNPVVTTIAGAIAVTAIVTSGIKLYQASNEAKAANHSALAWQLAKSTPTAKLQELGEQLTGTDQDIEITTRWASQMQQAAETPKIFSR